MQKYQVLMAVEVLQEIDNDFKEKYFLRDFIKRENIELKVNCKDWKDAISKGVDILIRKNNVTEAYKSEIIKKLELWERLQKK